MREVAHANGLIAGMHCTRRPRGACARGRGFQLITVGVDSSLYKTTVSR